MRKSLSLSLSFSFSFSFSLIFFLSDVFLYLTIQLLNIFINSQISKFVSDIAFESFILWRKLHWPMLAIADYYIYPGSYLVMQFSNFHYVAFIYGVIGSLQMAVIGLIFGFIVHKWKISNNGTLKS